MAIAYSTQLARTTPGGTPSGVCLIRTDECGGNIRTLNFNFVVPASGAGMSTGDYILGVKVPCNMKVIRGGIGWSAAIGDTNSRIQMGLYDGTTFTDLGGTFSGCNAATVQDGVGTVALGKMQTYGAGAGSLEKYLCAKVAADLTGTGTLYVWLDYVPIAGV